MIAKRSKRGLIQEDHYPNEFKVLVCCLLLNRTRGTQVRSVIDRIFERWPDAQSMAKIAFVTPELIAAEDILRPLGLQQRRARILSRFAREYLSDWTDPRELHGVGEYAFDCWRIFFLEDLGDEAPKDHALVDYWVEAKEEGSFWPRDGWGHDPVVEERRRRYLDGLGRG